MIDINDIERIFKDSGIKAIYSDPYFYLDISDNQQEYKVYIDTLGFIINRSSRNLSTFISIDLENTSMDSIVEEVIKNLDYLKHYEEVNKEILDFSITSLSNMYNDHRLKISRGYIEKIYHIVYKVDGIYQHKLFINIPSMGLQKDELSIVFDINNRFAQICDYDLYFYNNCWWDVNYGIQPNRILYQVDIDKFINQPNYTSISIIIVGMITEYFDYFYWSTYNGKHLHEDYKVNLSLDKLKNCEVYCKEGVSPLVGSIVEIYNKALESSAFKSVIGKLKGSSTILKNLDPIGTRRSDDPIDIYKVYGMDNCQDVIHFITEILYNDELGLKKLIYAVIQIIYNEKYYAFTRSYPLITAEVDYKTKDVRIRCSHYLHPGKKIDFILEFIIEKDRAYYNIINSVKGNINNIPIEDISGSNLETICKEYILGSYREIPEEVFDRFEGEV